MDATAGSAGPAPRPAIMAQLSVRRGREAVAFYQAAFGAVEVHRVGGTDDLEGVVSQLTVGGASFWVSDESPAHGNFSPESIGGSTVRMLLVVDDPDAAIDRAVHAGASLTSPAGNEHGWRLGRVEDPYGHSWEIGKPLGSWPPAAARPVAGAEPAQPDEHTEHTERTQPAEPAARNATVTEIAAVLAAMADADGVSLTPQDMDEYVEAFRALKLQGESGPAS